MEKADASVQRYINQYSSTCAYVICWRTNLFSQTGQSILDTEISLNMVITAQQTNTFFTGNDQMAIPALTVDELTNEGINTIEDLGEFEDADFKQIATNLKSPPSIPDPNNPGQTIRQAPFVLGAKSLKRLKVAANAVRYYESTNRALSATNMHYINVLQTFALEYESLIQRKKEDKPDVPKITKKTSVPKWSESFNDFLHRIIGVRNAPLAYLVREDVAPGAASPLAPNKPFSTENGSVEGELIARLTHNSPVYKDDNSALYHFLEEATRGTIYSATLAPFTRSKNGRDAYLAIMSQHAGKDKWEKELKDHNEFLSTRLWKGNTNFTLESFIKQHRAAYITMQQCTQHVSFQLPNARSRVTYLLDAIQNSDAELQAALASVRRDDPGMRDDFEKAAAYLLPSCPVARKKKGIKRPLDATVAAANGHKPTPSPKTQLKPGIGKTGVELRFYKVSEYKKLTDDQKMELAEWRQNRKKNKKDSPKPTPDGPANKKLKTLVSQAIAQELKQMEDAKSKEEEEREIIRQTLVSFVESHQKQAKPTSVKSSDASVAAVNQAITGIQGILKRSKK